MIIVTTIVVLVGFVALCWMCIFLFINDFSVPTEDRNKKKKILVVYPHPDDEILTAGGVMAGNRNTTLLILTKGERGTFDAHRDTRLKSLRTNEEKVSSKILSVKKLIQKDYGDGELIDRKKEIAEEIITVIDNEKPDLIITYDLSGFYGHPDHMIVSETVTGLVKNKYKKIELWYTTVPKRIYQLLKVPEHMAEDRNFKKKRTLPTLKIFVGLHVINKILANRSHKSQYKPFQEGLPFPIPVVFFQSMTLFEYFYKAN